MLWPTLGKHSLLCSMAILFNKRKRVFLLFAGGGGGGGDGGVLSAMEIVFYC